LREGVYEGPVEGRGGSGIRRGWRWSRII